MEDKYTMVRVSRLTAARLRALAGRLSRAAAEGRTVCGAATDHINPRAGRVSMDSLIGVLLDRDLRHRERRAESERRLRRARAARRPSRAQVESAGRENR